MNPFKDGIIACTYDANSQALAERIHESIDLESNDLANKLLSIYRPKHITIPNAPGFSVKRLLD